MKGERRIRLTEQGQRQMRNAPATLATSVDTSVPTVLSGASTVKVLAISLIFVGIRIRRVTDQSLKVHPKKVEIEASLEADPPTENHPHIQPRSKKIRQIE